MGKRTQRVLTGLAGKLSWVILLGCLIGDCVGGFVVASPRSSSDENPPADLQEVRTLARQHRWKEAATQIESLLKQHPDDSQLFYWRGVVRFQLADNIGAIMAFRSAERLGMNTADLHKALGFAYWRIHQYSLFERQLQKVMQLNPLD